jgi:hypothetical protein
MKQIKTIDLIIILIKPISVTMYMSKLFNLYGLKWSTSLKT